MFLHKGSRRTFSHNIRLASTLSFVAGIVNIAGVLSVATLTTNVTGHFAFFAEEISLKNYTKALNIIVYIFFFLLGAFTCNLLVEIVSRKKPRMAHALPMFTEIVILTSVGFSTDFNPNYIAYALLFAMGLQNALVTNISQSVVRTTHLTGLFTDLGIELSQLFFYKKETEMKRLTRSIFLRISIILFFFIGGVLGGLLFKSFQLKILLFAVVILVVALFLDNAIIYYNLTKRKIKIMTSKSS
ncbi:MAG: YoaK family protein [Flavobacterium sp.]|uniref:YoaK family protein n=1 Tax=Flavobacterium sp. TaxID=239 RepID=UPI0035299CAC